MAENMDTLGGYTEDEPEYWILLAESIGNPIPDEQEGDDSEFVDETGTVFKESTPKEDK
jgi:hypothetical protein